MQEKKKKKKRRKTRERIEKKNCTKFKGVTI